MVANTGLLNGLSDADLEAYVTKHKGNASVEMLVKGELEARSKAREEAKSRLAEFEAQVVIEERFQSDLGKVIAKLPHPDSIHNVYLAWREVEEEIGKAEPVEITQADGSKAVEMRKAKVKSTKWVVELNKGFAVKGSTDTVRKNAVSIWKSNGGQAPAFVGNFRSCQKACEHLGIVVGKQNARIPLQAAGYMTQPYDGTDYLA